MPANVQFQVYDQSGENRLGELVREVEHAYCEHCGDCVLCSHDGECFDGARPFTVLYEDDLTTEERDRLGKGAR